jgi:hypothetical protein
VNRSEAPTPVLRQDSADGFNEILRQESDWDATDFGAATPATTPGAASPAGQNAAPQPLAPSSAPKAVTADALAALYTSRPSAPQSNFGSGQLGTPMMMGRGDGGTSNAGYPQMQPGGVRSGTMQQRQPQQQQQQQQQPGGLQLGGHQQYGMMLQQPMNGSPFDGMSRGAANSMQPRQQTMPSPSANPFDTFGVSATVGQGPALFPQHSASALASAGQQQQGQQMERRPSNNPFDAFNSL